MTVEESMKILGTVTAIPPRTMGVPRKGQYHPEVLQIIDAVQNLDDGEWVQVEFPDARKAAMRASALRKAGYAAYTRKNILFAGFSNPEDGDDEDDGEEDDEGGDGDE